MAVEVQPDTPLAEAIQNAIQAKLAEMGWTSGGLDDSALAEYIVLMVVSGKTPEEVESELSTDLLDDPAAIAKAPEFSRWLFERLEQLSGQSSEPQGDAFPDASAIPDQPQISQIPGQDSGGQMNDADMGEDSADGSIPTGPKNMRGGKPKDRRTPGQFNKTPNRPGEQTLHRIKGAAGGAGRINSHSQNVKGPSGAAPRGPRATMNRLANAQPTPQQMSQMQQQMAQQPNNPFLNMSPEQQMQLFAMYEQQAKMMSQIFGTQPQNQQMMPGYPPQPQNAGKSLFDRVDSRAGGVARKNGDEIDPNSSMEVEPSSFQNSPRPGPDSSTTVCRFNLSCTKPDCPFVHQSPAAPAGTVIDMTDTCAFGAACKNRKCTGKHPSPAKLSGSLQHSSTNIQECRFYPNCTNPNCPFQHPTMPPCRNGADCTVVGCKFFHSKIQCKFDPCLNPSCPYKHVEGQKRGSYADKVWTKTNTDGDDHVSDRRFVDDEAGEEELIRPGQNLNGASNEEGAGHEGQPQEQTNTLQAEAQSIVT